jgi:predicted phosphodiesterase
LVRLGTRDRWKVRHFVCFSLICLVLICNSQRNSQAEEQPDPFSSTSACSNLGVRGVTSSGAESVHPPSGAIDQRLDTRWSNLGLGSWIQFDLGQSNVICSVGVNWHRGNERVNTFVISVSNDGKSFTNVFSGKSGLSVDEQKYDIQSKTARFIKVTVSGNTQNNWVSIAEVKIYGNKPISDSCSATTTSPILEIWGQDRESAFPPVRATDGRLDTIWSSYGIGSYIDMDLGSKSNICGIEIAWFKGDQRQNNFEISTSMDGKSYKTVLDAKSSGKSASFEKYSLSTANNFAQFIRITVNGNTQNNYASISEIKVKVSQSQPQFTCTDNVFNNVKTSGSQSSFPGLNVIDGDLNTRWSNYGKGSWIEFDLGLSNKVCSVNIAWHRGDQRQNDFVISASTDGTNFANILSEKSSGTTLNLEKYRVADTNARYIRITVNGNTENLWSSITEVTIGTASSPGSTVVIGAAGDWGSARNDNWEQIVDLMIDNKINLALGLGDYSYGTVSEFEPVTDTLKQSGIPFKGVRGNHDTSSYSGLFGQPSMLYAFNAGQARIILLNTEDSVSSNSIFLENELKNTQMPWKIVAMHNPLYTSPSNHPEETELASKLQPLFDRYGVQLVLYGHNHNYERIKLPDKPTVFVQAGTGGESHYDIKGSRPGGGVEFQDDNDFGFVKLTISPSNILGQFIDVDKQVLDSFTISK